ncbi:MAG: GGDEF domain-containing protein, partial [Rubrivivax sp.]
MTAAPAHLAQAALRRLASAQLEPTPDQFARAYAQEAAVECGAPLVPVADAPIPAQAAWPQLTERLARGLDRSSRHWTAARKKDSLQRVFDGSRSDARRLQQRLHALIGAWEGEHHDGVDGTALTTPAPVAAPAPAPATPTPTPTPTP